MSAKFFRLTELRDRLALDGMNRTQIAELMDRMAQDSPNRTYFMPYNATDAATALGWRETEIVKVTSAAVRAGR